MLPLGMQSCAVFGGGQLAHSLKPDQRMQDLSGGGALGLFGAFLLLFGGAFSIITPKVASRFLASAGVLCVLGAGTGFSDLLLWGVLSFVLAGMAHASASPSPQGSRILSDDSPPDEPSSPKTKEGPPASIGAQVLRGLFFAFLIYIGLPVLAHAVNP